MAKPGGTGSGGGGKNAAATPPEGAIVGTDAADVLFGSAADDDVFFL